MSVANASERVRIRDLDADNDPHEEHDFGNSRSATNDSFGRSTITTRAPINYHVQERTLSRLLPPRLLAGYLLTKVAYHLCP